MLSVGEFKKSIKWYLHCTAPATADTELSIADNSSADYTIASSMDDEEQLTMVKGGPTPLAEHEKPMHKLLNNCTSLFKSNSDLQENLNHLKSTQISEIIQEMFNGVDSTSKSLTESAMHNDRMMSTPDEKSVSSEESSSEEESLSDGEENESNMSLDIQFHCFKCKKR